jgi:hypothetical protein
MLAPHLNLFTHETMVKIGSHVVDYDAWVLLSAIVAGWLMGLLNWLINSVKNSLTRIFLIFMITGVIGFEVFTTVLLVILRFWSFYTQTQLHF